MKLIIFDLDGTLAESKQPITEEMSKLIVRLLSVVKVAIISGGAFHQFLKQVVDLIPSDANLSNLFILPTSGASFYEFDPSASSKTNWKKIYEERLSEKEADTIINAMREASVETGLIDFSEPAYGERIEYRGGQVTMSALGQQAPLVEKKMWDPDHTKRHILQENIVSRLPEFSVGIGGATSIDVSKRGIDKAYGIRKLCERLKIDESETMYVGDELESGGNDEVVYKTMVQTKSVKNPSETAKFIENFLNKNV